MHRRWIFWSALIVVLLIASVVAWGMVSPIGELAVRNLLGQSAAYITDEDGRIVGILPRDLDHHINPRDKSNDIDNLDGTLNEIVRLYETEGLKAAMIAVPIPGPTSDSVLVLLHQELFAEGTGSTAEIAQSLQVLGIESLVVGESYISLFVPIGLLVEVADLDHVQFIEVEFPSMPLQSSSSGALGTNAAPTHGAAAWHAAGYTGKGVKVGIIDVGFEKYADLQKMGEVPPPVDSGCFSNVKQEPLEKCPKGELHGTAVTEALMDMAPEASVYLAQVQGDPTHPTSLRSAVALANAVFWMVLKDVDIINYSVEHHWDSPGDGSIFPPFSPLGSVDMAVQKEIIWVQAAGNKNMTTWHGLLNLASPTLPERLRSRFGKKGSESGLKLNPRHAYLLDNVFVKPHQFLPGNTCNTLKISLAQSVQIQMRWEDEWYGARRDLDFHIYKYPPNFKQGWNVNVTPLKEASAPQSGRPADRPLEKGAVRLSKGRYCIYIHDYSARQQGRAEPPQVQLMIWGGPGLSLASYSGTGSISNPAESSNPGMLTVGAAHGGAYFSIADYSSRGPTMDGRLKPDLVGVAGEHSTAYGRPFNGTSQAAPHVAGLAALVIQRFRTSNQFNTPEEVANYLRDNATLAIAGPAQPFGPVAPKIPDSMWGYGLAWLPPPVPLISLPFSGASKGNLVTTAGCQNSGSNNSQCMPLAAGQIQADLKASEIREILVNIRKRFPTIPNFRNLQKLSRIYVLVDTSGSMGGIKLEQATLNLSDFIFELKGIAPEAHLSVIAFDNDVHPVGDKIITLWNNEDVVLSAGGGTDMYKAITYVYEEQVNGIEDGSRAIVIAMTDGISDPTLKEEALALIRNSKIPNSFFAIGYGADADLTSLRELTPSVQHVIQTESVQFIFDAILQSITN